MSTAPPGAGSAPVADDELPSPAGVETAVPSAQEACDPPAVSSWPLRFVGSGSEYFRIWIVNLLLTVVTLGLYYPYAKVRRLRYFHGATEVAGHPLAFQGDPAKMLRGYLLVGALFLAYSLAGHFSATAGMIALMLVAALWPTLWHASLRFRLANTGWRGLRLRFSGGRADAYKAMAGPVLLALIGAGLALVMQPPPEAAGAGAGPGADAPQLPPGGGAATAWFSLLPLVLMGALLPLFLWMLRRYQHAHYALAVQQCRFSVGLGAFYKLFALTALIALAVAVTLLGGGAVLVGVLAGGWAGWAGAADGQGNQAGLVMLVGLGAFAFYVLAFSLAGGYFTARLQNLCWNGTRSPMLAFESQLKARALAGLWVKNWLLIMLTLGLYYPFAAIATARLRLQAVTLRSEGDLEQIVASARSADETAAGDAAGDLFGIDIGL
jgi:uncharacterized membrane protein YjgN (DUF898 family)